MSTGWQEVQAEVLRRIQNREWPPGGLIPGEVALAREFGCARATVNRALQALADDGWLERRRRAGTRVALSPLRRAQMSVAVLRKEVEALGKTYGHRLLMRKVAGCLLSLQTLHQADGAPYGIEDREIDLTHIPAAGSADFTILSANEWLVQNAPFDHGNMSYMSEGATAFDARHLECEEATPLLVLYRETFSEAGRITRVRLAHAPGHVVRLQI